MDTPAPEHLPHLILARDALKRQRDALKKIGTPAYLIEPIRKAIVVIGGAVLRIESRPRHAQMRESARQARAARAALK